MEKVHLESVQFADYRILRHTNAKKGFERLREFSVKFVSKLLLNTIKKPLTPFMIQFACT